MREADLKRCVADYLQIGTNQGRWYHDRLNSGSLLAKRGDKTYKVNLCRIGTADYLVLKWEYPTGAPNKGWTRVIFLELKGKGGKESDDQANFAEAVGKQGCEYHIIKSIEELQCLMEGE